MKDEELDVKQKEFRDWFRETQHRYWHDLLNDAFYDQYVFRKKENGYFVEIGALDGWTCSQTIYFEMFRGWDGVIVEPNPKWLDELKHNRSSIISTEAISNVRGKNKFVCREQSAYSHLEDSDLLYGPQEVDQVIDIKTITLCDLLDNNNAPDEIDFVSIDTEGYELKILENYFEENKKYKINLISIEHFNSNDVNYFFRDKPYIQIKNPLLHTIKVDKGESGLGILRLRDDLRFYVYDAARTYFGDVHDLDDIDFEYYYVHVDFLAENLHLKKYII